MKIVLAILVFHSLAAIADPVDIPRAINFDRRVISISPDQQARIDAAAQWLKENPDLRIHLVGHSDSEECLPESERTSPHLSAPLCYDTGISRAIMVSNTLRAKGITSKQLISDKSKGETEPIASNDTEEGRALNRRVEFEVYKP